MTFPKCMRSDSKQDFTLMTRFRCFTFKTKHLSVMVLLKPQVKNPH